MSIFAKHLLLKHKFGDIRGAILDSQAPQFLKLDGSRAMTGNLTLETVGGIFAIVRQPLPSECSVWMQTNAVSAQFGASSPDEMYGIVADVQNNFAYLDIYEDTFTTRIQPTTATFDGANPITISGALGTVDGVDVSLQDALRIKGKVVDDSAIGDDKILVYDLATQTLVYEAKPTGGDIAYQNVKGTTDDTTTSTDFEDFDQMTLTVATSGTYLIQFTMAGLIAKATAGNIILVFRLLIDDVETMGCNLGGNSLLQLRGFSSFITVRSLTANDVVKVQWKVSYSGTTGYCRAATEISENRELTILKLA